MKDMPILSAALQLPSGFIAQFPMLQHLSLNGLHRRQIPRYIAGGPFLSTTMVPYLFKNTDRGGRDIDGVLTACNWEFPLSLGHPKRVWRTKQRC